MSADGERGGGWIRAGVYQSDITPRPKKLLLRLSQRPGVDLLRVLLHYGLRRRQHAM